MDLLPCPFCGGTDLSYGPDGGPQSIACHDCCATIPYLSLDDPQSVRWNTRHDHTADLLEAMESINRMISPGSRTFDEMIRDMGYACDRARAAISRARGNEEATQDQHGGSHGR